MVGLGCRGVSKKSQERRRLLRVFLSVLVTSARPPRRLSPISFGGWASFFVRSQDRHNIKRYLTTVGRGKYSKKQCDSTWQENSRGLSLRRVPASERFFRECVAVGHGVIRMRIGLIRQARLTAWGLTGSCVLAVLYRLRQKDATIVADEEESPRKAFRPTEKVPPRCRNLHHDSITVSSPPRSFWERFTHSDARFTLPNGCGVHECW